MQRELHGHRPSPSPDGSYLLQYIMVNALVKGVKQVTYEMNVISAHVTGHFASYIDAEAKNMYDVRRLSVFVMLRSGSSLDTGLGHGCVLPSSHDHDQKVDIDEMVQSMRAWTWTGPGQLELRDQAIPEPASQQVLVAIQAAGICSTDLHVIGGGVQFVSPPHVLGHEGVGRVVRVGAQVTRVQVGDRCAIDTVIGCGTCRYCRAGRKHLCDAVQEIGQTIPGLWAEYCVVPEGNLWPLPQHVSDAAGTQAETLHCVMGGIERLQPQAGETALILGCGSTGILFARMLKLRGVGKVAITGSRPNRLAAARALGADQTINVRESGAEGYLSGRRFDIVVDALGTPESVWEAGHLAASGGRVLLFGIPGNDRAAIDVKDAIWREITFLASGNAPHVWPPMMALLDSRQVDLEPLVTDVVPFEELPRAVDLACTQRDRTIKVVVRMARWS
jgi:2-desacetyl-2-hydroxyethyl bacteriochlorophyllide A dehydrogenase